MTIIDTTLYCNGELRLARHGAGRGGNVLTLVATGDQISLLDEQETLSVEEIIADYLQRLGYVDRPDYIFDSVRKYHEGFTSAYCS